MMSDILVGVSIYPLLPTRMSSSGCSRISHMLQHMQTIDEVKRPVAVREPADITYLNW
jgi:hypothetical protein